MYRAVIEHPEFMPPELKNRPDLTLGKERGRIWRIVPEQASRGRQPPAGLTRNPQLSQATTAKLVKLLEHPDAWWRTTAQRLLLERQDKEAIPLLKKLLTESKEPLARLHAAYLLHARSEECDGLPAGWLLLNDPHPRLREHGVQLLRHDPRFWHPHAVESELIRLRKVVDRLEELAHDADPRVRFQVALAAGDFRKFPERSLRLLAQVTLAGADDPWTRLAVASSVPEQAGALIETLLTHRQFAPQTIPSHRLVLVELAAIVGARRNADEVAALLGTLRRFTAAADPHWQFAVLNGLADGMSRRGTRLTAFLESLGEAHRAQVKQAETLFTRAETLLREKKPEDVALRLEAVRLLAHGPWSAAARTVAPLVTDDSSQDVRLAAVRALAAHPHKEVPALLMKHWPSYSPALRREVTEAMFRQPDRILFLLREVEAGRVKPGDLDALRTRQLLNHGRADIRTLAEKLLRDNLPEERKQVLARYKAALTMKGDAQRGREVFRKNCANCHRVAGVGVEVGPDISDTRTKTAEQLLLDILNPNAAIDNNYVNYIVRTRNGQVYTGMLAADTASSITLRRAENQTDTILRQDIDALQSTGLSLMPDDLEKGITVAEMADLLSFLKNWRYLDGDVPLGDDGKAGGPRSVPERPSPLR